MRTCFGPFCVDAETRQLFRDSQEVHLSPKAFDLLCALVARRPNVIAKEDLLGLIWPDTFVVEANLNVLIGEIRRALGDDARAPRFIRTAHGIGYAFCGEAADVRRAVSSGGVHSYRAWLEGTDRTYLLADGDNTIGRDPRCSVCLNDSSVSRVHARIRITGSAGAAVLEDLGSTNGTFVERRRIDAPAPLADGHTVEIGSVTLRFRAGAGKLPATRRVRGKARDDA